jgi:hypothetical protein
MSIDNFAEFAGLAIEPDGSTVLSWRASDAPNPWGDLRNRHSGCKFRFRGVTAVTVTGPVLLTRVSLVLGD